MIWSYGATKEISYKFLKNDIKHIYFLKFQNVEKTNISASKEIVYLKIGHVMEHQIAKMEMMNKILYVVRAK